MHWTPRLDEDPILITRHGSTEFIVDNIDDMPVSAKQLLKLLTRLGYKSREVHLMLEEFKANPRFTEAHFGMNGLFLYCK